MKKKILLLFLAFVFIFSGCKTKEEQPAVNREQDYALPSYSQSQIDLFLNAHSTNKFTDKVVTLAQIENILKAAVNSPSISNSEGCHFTAVMKEEYMKQIVPEATKGCAVIIVSAPTAKDVDAGVATQSIFLAAQSLDFGAKISTNNIDLINTGNLKQFFGVPEGFDAVSAVCIGYTDESDLSNDIKEINIDGFVNYIE